MNTNQRGKLCRDQMWLEMSCSHGGKLTFYSLWYFIFIWNPAKEANRWWCNLFQSNIFPRHIYHPPPPFFYFMLLRKWVLLRCIFMMRGDDPDGPKVSIHPSLAICPDRLPLNLSPALTAQMHRTTKANKSEETQRLATAPAQSYGRRWAPLLTLKYLFTSLLLFCHMMLLMNYFINHYMSEYTEKWWPVNLVKNTMYSI